MNDKNEIIVPEEDIQIIESNVAQMESAAIDIQISTAKAYPRVLSDVREKVLTLATIDQETAVSCHYAKPVGGKQIVGPSVRLAEIIVATYGNLRCKSYVVDEKLKSVTVRADAWDLESNSAISVEVTRSLMNKLGKRYPDHLVITTSNAALAIAYRNAVYKIVPMSLFKDQTNKIKAVAAGSGKTLQQQAVDCVNAFADYKIDEKEFLQIANLRRLDDITVDDIIGMRSVYTSLKDGSIKKSDLLKKAKGKSDLGDAEMEESKNG